MDLHEKTCQPEKEYRSAMLYGSAAKSCEERALAKHHGIAESLGLQAMLISLVISSVNETRIAKSK